MAFFDAIKNLFNKKEKKPKPQLEETNLVSIYTMERKYEIDDLVGAARDLKELLEEYGRRKQKNNRYKGREFIYFILSNKHKDMKSSGYKHWKNINDIISLNHKKVYPYHKNNLRNAMDFFQTEIKSIRSIELTVE